jgi:NAD(P)-dependent dehydrogenase (short-subunit alcohol dehydrogenase family)
VTSKNNLSGRTVLITGGTRGLGREMALCLARSGANLCITGTKRGSEFYKATTELASISGDDNFIAEIVNVCDPKAMSDFVDLCINKFSKIDVLINNAGRGMRIVSEKFNTTPTKFWETDPISWSTIVSTNINGPFYATRAVVPFMIKKKFGKIINISTSSQTMIRSGYSPYGPSKAFLEAASRVWAHDLNGTGVDVNVLLPGGAADTDFLPTSNNKKGADGNLLPASIMNDAIIWLVSDESNGISGSRFIGRYWDDLDFRQDGKGLNPQIM